nr:uncharacterized protein LOC117217980 [Megalopta genalis]
MESLFQLKYDDFDIFSLNIKKRLMLQDQDVQVACITRLTNLFKDGASIGNEAVVSKLIKYDVLSSIFEILQTLDNHLLPMVLDFLSLVIVYRKFYESHVAMAAVDSMLKVAICITKSRCKENQLLEKLIAIVYDILNRAVGFHVDFEAVCVPRQVLSLLKSLIFGVPSYRRIKFLAAALLNIVLEHTNAKDEWEDVAFELCHKALDLMKEIVDFSDDEASIAMAANALCALCAAGTRLCSAANESSAGTFDKIQLRGAALTKSVYSVTMNTLIPCPRDDRPNETDSERTEFHGNLVAALSSLYELRECDRDNLSNHLAANGYLKRFLLSTTGLPGYLRRNTCVLLSRVVTVLASKSMPIGRWPSDVSAFENLMHRGLLDLPNDQRRWNDVLARWESSATALTTLIYYHFRATREHDTICLRSLIVRITSLPCSEQPPSWVLKVLWFLFAVGSVYHPSPNSEQDYGNAVRRLAAALQRSKLDECYSHHIDLLRYCLKCPEVPKDLRTKATGLWLADSDGNIEPLLALGCDNVVRHHLLHLVQTGCPEKIIGLAMKGIRRMVRDDNKKEIGEIAWYMLPKLLSTYSPDKAEQIKAVLELANLFIPDWLSAGVKSRCADRLTTIVTRRDTDSVLRTLAIMQSYDLLVTSATSKPFTILEKYVGAPNFLEELLLRGFSEETPELSAVCLKLLAFVVHFHERSFVRRDKPLTIDVQSLADLLFNTRKSVHIAINGMQLVLELFTGNIDGSPVRLDGVVGGAINLYETLWIVHGISDPTRRDIVYQCLEGLLRFCRKHAEPLMYHLCTLMSNYSLVTSTLSSRCVTSHFRKFVSSWLRCRKRYCNDEGPWTERSICKTPFEDTWDLVKKYVDTVDDKVDPSFYDLRYAVSDSQIMSQHVGTNSGCCVDRTTGRPVTSLPL